MRGVEGGQGDKLRCETSAFVLAVNVQMRVMKNDIQVHFRQEVRWGRVRWEGHRGGEVGVKSGCLIERSVKSN